MFVRMLSTQFYVFFLFSLRLYFHEESHVIVVYIVPPSDLHDFPYLTIVRIIILSYKATDLSSRNGEKKSGRTKLNKSKCQKEIES